MHRSSLRATLAVLFAGAFLNVPVARAEQITLRVADYFPAGHFVAEYGAKEWMRLAAEYADGEVSFDYYPAEQLGKAKDMLSLTQSGVVDIGVVAPSYVTDKLPLAAVAELPEAFTTSCEGTLAYWPLAREGGLIDQKEFKPLGVRAVFALVLSPFQLYTSNTPLDDLENLNGTKLRTTGAAKVLVVRRLWSVPVQMAAPELMEAISRGTVDGVLLSHSSTVDYDLQHHLKYSTTGENFGSSVVMYMMSRESWDALPSTVQQAFARAGEEVTRSSCIETERDTQASKSEIAAAGVDFTALDGRQRARLLKTLSDVSQQWATDLDSRDKLGSEVLKAFQAELAKTLYDETDDPEIDP